MEMPYTLTFEDRGTYLYAHLTGQDSFAASLSYWNEISDKIHAHGYKKLLLHENLKGAITQTEIQEVVADLLDSGLMGVQIAFFDECDSDRHLNAFGQQASNDRGGAVTIFNTLEAARLWIEQEVPALPASTLAEQGSNSGKAHDTDSPETGFNVEPRFNTGRQVSGIGGWLILPIIGLFVSIFKLGYILLGTFFPLLASGNWRVLTTPGCEHYDPLWGPLLVFEAVGNLVSLIWVVVLLILLFSKSPAFPKTMITFFVCNIAFLAIDMVLCQQIPLTAGAWEESLGELVPVVIGALIWIPYFLRSERVKNTFTKN